MSDDAKDLIERLRAIRNRVTFTSEAWERTMEQAADTIAALTAEQDAAEQRIRELEAEVERLLRCWQRRCLICARPEGGKHG